MADYIPILNTQIEPLAPVTSELMSQLRDNPIAIAQGSTGAPRVAESTFSLSSSSSGTSVLTGVEEYGGMWFDLFADAGSPGGSSTLLTLAVSDDGVTYSSEITLVDLDVGETSTVKGFVDFTAGSYQIISFYGSPSRSVGTIGSYPSGTISHVRFTRTFVGGGSIAAIGRFNGGEAQLV